MKDKVYNSFGLTGNRKKYICKSEITRGVLKDIGIPDFITIEQVKNEFDNIAGIYVYTGSQFDPKKRKATKFVKKFELYKKVIK